MDSGFTRLKDKVAIVGFANATRHLAPFDDDSYEIWTINEAGNVRHPSFSWVKRIDRLFQIHPRWDFTRENNANDPNHWLWLQNKADTCIACKGSGCENCVEGIYTPHDIRTSVKYIYMQEEYADIPNSIEYPLEFLRQQNPAGKYFTSSLSYMLMLASMMTYTEISLYGFEMAAQTEYFHQRACAEYLIGYMQGQGLNVKVPSESSLLKGELYGYENMKTGYRQQLDMRIAVLENQLSTHNIELARIEGELRILGQLDSPELMAETQTKHGKALGLVNVIKGAKHETENLRKLYDTYFVLDGANGQTNTRKVTEEHVKKAYDAI